MRLFFLFTSCFILLSCDKKMALQWTSQESYPAYQPVFLNLDGEEISDQALQITHANFSSPVYLQKSKEDQWCFITPTAIEKGETFKVSVPPDLPELSCKIMKEPEHLVVTIDGKEVLKYATATQYPPDSLPAYYQRSGFIHPLKTLNGEVLTADFPAGHVHQHGIFHAWTRSHVRDSMIDFWNQQAGLGTVRHKEVLEVENGPVFSQFRVVLEYLAFLPEDTLIVSEETWNVRIYPMRQYYLVDWKISHQCLEPDSLVLDEYHYGGAAFRGAENWNVEKGAYDSLVFFSTSEGKSQLDGNHSRPTWVTMSGKTTNGFGGITMFQHRENFRYPQPVRIHPTMPYFCFAPMVLGSFTLQPGDLYESAYRFLIFDDKPDLSLIDDCLHAYHAVSE